MGFHFLGEFFIAKFNNGGNRTVAWRVLQNVSSLRGRGGGKKKDPFVEGDSRRESFLLFVLVGNVEQANHSGFFAQVPGEGLGPVPNFAKLSAWASWLVPAPGLGGGGQPPRAPQLVMLLLQRQNRGWGGHQQLRPLQAAISPPASPARSQFKAKLPFP